MTQLAGSVSDKKSKAYHSAHAGQEEAFSQEEQLSALIHRIREPLCVLHDGANGRRRVVPASEKPRAGEQVVGILPAIYPEWLGDRSFFHQHQTRFAYVGGAMANGIASEELVVELARHGMLGFFGAAGLGLERVGQAVDRLTAELGDLPWGSNLIHTPNEPQMEAQVVELYLRKGVRRVSAAAFMGLSDPLVAYAYGGIRRLDDGSITRPNHVFAKISHPSVARHFLQPAPEGVLNRLVARGQLTQAEAQLARQLPVAEDLTAESDSGGHTDNRPLGALLPTICQLRDELAARYGYQRSVRVGAAGGLGTPRAIAAAFQMGAAYVLTGSVNQGCVESGLHTLGKALLANADLADVVMAPAADMFEMGVEVQVLRRGSLFAPRAKTLYEVYRGYGRWEDVPGPLRAKVEKNILRQSFDAAWAATASYWQARDPQEVQKAEADPKHRMALVFRAYLGQASRWAISGNQQRRSDYQIWCGPAMGAFNEWTRGSFLQAPEERRAGQVALNLMEGAAVIARASQLRMAGVDVPAAAFAFVPRPLAVGLIQTTSLADARCSLFDEPASAKKSVIPPSPAAR